MTCCSSRRQFLGGQLLSSSSDQMIWYGMLFQLSYLPEDDVDEEEEDDGEQLRAIPALKLRERRGRPPLRLMLRGEEEETASTPRRRRGRVRASAASFAMGIDLASPTMNEQAKRAHPSFPLSLSLSSNNSSAK